MTRHTVGNPAEALFVQLTRRRVLERGLAVAAGAILELSALAAGSTSKVKGMAFDAFAVFDPRPVATLTEKLYPGSGVALTNLWRTRQFEYTWLRTISGRYSDFMRVTEEALVFATRTLKLDLPSDIRDELLQAYLGLEAWPDAAPVLQKLKAASVRLVILSNFTPAMLSGGIKAAGLDGVFEHVLSTDLVKTYKPDPRAYQLGIDALGLPREQIVFAAFAGWDAAGAKTFGYPTYWVNRLGLPPEELGILPDGTGANLTDLAALVG
jgi:2-haloacid dehalogenase